MHPRSRFAAAAIAALMVSMLAPLVPAAAQDNRPPIASMKVTVDHPYTRYLVTASDPDGHDVDYYWSGEVECGHFYVTTGDGAEWLHSDGDPPACNHDRNGHSGTVSAIVTDRFGGRTICTHEGSGPADVQCGDDDPQDVESDQCTIDMRLFDGMKGETPKDVDETSRGAFTVLNTNDSDDRGGPDTSQTSIDGEKDLMKLRLLKPEPSAGGIVTLYFPTERVRIWRTAQKDKQIQGDPWIEYPVGALPTTVWVEGTGVSQSVRDLTFSYLYRPTTDEIACEDEAKATIISTRLDGALHDATDTVWEDMPAQPRDLFDRLCGGVGLRPTGPSPRGVRNCIALRFEVLPPDAAKEPGLLFDVTRQKASESHIEVPGSIDDFDRRQTRFPDGEKANDDKHDHDENKVPTGAGILFVFDGPGTATHDSGTSRAARFFYDADFREFVRVRFDGVRPTGNVETGTRAGPIVRWVARHSLVSTRAKVWVRTTGNEAEARENTVETRS